MSFQPVLPGAGLGGWAYLSRTRDAQQAALSNAPAQQRDTAYFTERIGQVQRAEDLVADRRLLSVALGAFGLEDDLSNTYFIRKVLEDGTLEPGALANRLSDKRYLALSKAFGFGDFNTPRTVLSDFPAEITGRYADAQFERAVGAQSETMRLALSMDRLLDETLATTSGDTARWFTIMGQPPLRRVFDTAFGLPTAVATLDLDRQLGIFRDKAETLLGSSSVEDLADPDTRERLRSLFLARSEPDLARAGTSSAAAALTLLQQGGSAGGLFALLPR